MIDAITSTAAPRIFSGVQPTGNLHLGNYLGAIKQWVALQHDYESIFCIVDLHAITVLQNPDALRKATLEMAAAYIAAGIDPEKCIIFPQSMVKEHTELAWMLGCSTPLGWLNRMTQFKDKAGKHKDQASLGLYGYPVLMAADILLYHATHVPVGEDQKQHLELTRDIAGAMNRQVNAELFTIPEPLIMGEATRVMSLRDGTSKMSKSDPSDMSRINLSDDDDTIRRKFQKAKTDMEPGITLAENRPESANLLRIYASLADISSKQAEAQFEGSEFSHFKKELAELTISQLAPMRDEMQRLLKDKAQLKAILKRGSEAASDIAATTIKDVKHALGFVRV